VFIFWNRIDFWFGQFVLVLVIFFLVWTDCFGFGHFMWSFFETRLIQIGII
jgi:hypothetical protein